MIFMVNIIKHKKVRTNLTYVEPHRIIINDITFLTFNYSIEIFISISCSFSDETGIIS